MGKYLVPIQTSCRQGDEDYTLCQPLAEKAGLYAIDAGI